MSIQSLDDLSSLNAIFVKYILKPDLITIHWISVNKQKQALHGIVIYPVDRLSVFRVQCLHIRARDINNFEIQKTKISGNETKWTGFLA